MLLLNESWKSCDHGSPRPAHFYDKMSHRARKKVCSKPAHDLWAAGSKVACLYEKVARVAGRSAESFYVSTSGSVRREVFIANTLSTMSVVFALWCLLVGNCSSDVMPAPSSRPAICQTESPQLLSLF